MDGRAGGAGNDTLGMLAEAMRRGKWDTAEIEATTNIGN